MKRRIHHRAREPGLELTRLRPPGVDADIEQIAGRAAWHDGKFARPAPAARIEGSHIIVETPIAGLLAQPGGKGRRQPARELARACGNAVEVREIHQPPSQAVVKNDALTMGAGTAETCC